MSEWLLYSTATAFDKLWLYAHSKEPYKSHNPLFDNWLEFWHALCWPRPLISAPPQPPERACHWLWLVHWIWDQSISLGLWLCPTSRRSWRRLSNHQRRTRRWWGVLCVVRRVIERRVSWTRGVVVEEEVIATDESFLFLVKECLIESEREREICCYCCLTGSQWKRGYDESSNTKVRGTTHLPTRCQTNVKQRIAITSEWCETCSMFDPSSIDRSISVLFSITIGHWMSFGMSVIRPQCHQNVPLAPFTMMCVSICAWRIVLNIRKIGWNWSALNWIDLIVIDTRTRLSELFTHMPSY